MWWLEKSSENFRKVMSLSYPTRVVQFYTSHSKGSKDNSLLIERILSSRWQISLGIYRSRQHKPVSSPNEGLCSAPSEFSKQFTLSVLVFFYFDVNHPKTLLGLGFVSYNLLSRPISWYDSKYNMFWSYYSVNITYILVKCRRRRNKTSWNLRSNFHTGIVRCNIKMTKNYWRAMVGLSITFGDWC